MPGLSGKETAQHIRALPGAARQVSVLALTASVTRQDEAVFRRAGMDGLLRKPVSLADLLAALNRFVWAGRCRQEKVSIPEKAPSLSVAVLNQERVAELRGNLPPDIFASLVEECLLGIDQRMPDLRLAVMARDADAVERQAHAIVGVAAGYGLSSLEICVRGVLSAARAGETAISVTAIVHAIDVERSRGAAALRVLLGKLTAERKTVDA